MPLHDVDWGHGPRNLRSFLFSWCARVSDVLNAQLPENDRRFAALMACRTRLKTQDQLRYFDNGPPPIWVDGKESGEHYPSFDAPPPHATVPARFADRMAVNLIDTLEGKHLAGSVLFVDEDHKSDSDGGLVFAVRVAALASAGAGVVVVDIAPGAASWAMHLNTLLPAYPTARRPRGSGATVLVIHPRLRGDAEQYDVWYHTVAVGESFPTVPLPVRGELFLKLDLEATYAEACTHSRIP
jgi:hypothetical protein